MSSFRYLFRIPHSNEFADYVWPGMIVNPEKIISLNEIEFGPDDVVIASYPKSGENPLLLVYAIRGSFLM